MKDKYALARDRIYEAIQHSTEFVRGTGGGCEFLLGESVSIMFDFMSIQDISSRSVRMDIEILKHIDEHIDRLKSENKRQTHILRRRIMEERCV